MVERLGCTGPCGDVVEFGCGYGTFTLPAARATAGRVLALDIDPGMVAATARKARAAGLANVAAEVRDFMADGCGVPDGRAGYAMLFNILHIEEPERLLREARRALAPGGAAGIVHWRGDGETPADRRCPSARRPSGAGRGASGPGWSSSGTSRCAAARGTGVWSCAGPPDGPNREGRRRGACPEAHRGPNARHWGGGRWQPSGGA
jgi:SAM-dependent methyltransferase